MATATATRPLRTIDDIPGWFRVTDQLVMDWLLTYQERSGATGDLLEMGAYLGKSAVLIGFHRRAGERLVVCDLFGEEPPTAGNRRTAAFYEDSLTREAFEANYAAFHAEPPDVIQAPTFVLRDELPPRTCRFVHIDACHLYDVVREDVETARQVLKPDGIVVFDDIRTVHTPGVAAAVWPEVAAGGLQPICITPSKLYATWGDAGSIVDAMLAWLAGQEGSDVEVQWVAGRKLLRVGDWTSAPQSPAPPARHAPPLPRQWLPSAVRAAIADLLPPLLTRRLRSARQRRR